MLVEVKVSGQVTLRDSLEAQTVALALREGSDKQVVEKATDHTLGWMLVVSQGHLTSSKKGDRHVLLWH